MVMPLGHALVLIIYLLTITYRKNNFLVSTSTYVSNFPTTWFIATLNSALQFLLFKEMLTLTLLTRTLVC